MLGSCHLHQLCQALLKSHSKSMTTMLYKTDDCNFVRHACTGASCRLQIIVPNHMMRQLRKKGIPSHQQHLIKTQRHCQAATMLMVGLKTLQHNTVPWYAATRSSRMSTCCVTMAFDALSMQLFCVSLTAPLRKSPRSGQKIAFCEV